MSCRDTEIRDRSMFLCLEAIRIPESQPFLLRVFLILQIYTPKTRMREHQRVRSFKKKQLLVAWFHTKKTHVQPNHFSIQHGLRMTFQFFPICIGANFSCLDKYCLGWKQIMFQLETIPFSKIETGKNHLQSLLFNPLQIVWMVFEWFPKKSSSKSVFKASLNFEAALAWWRAACADWPWPQKIPLCQAFVDSAHELNDSKKYFLKGHGGQNQQPSPGFLGWNHAEEANFQQAELSFFKHFGFFSL